MSLRTDISQNKVTYIKLVKFSEANDSVHVHAFPSLESTQLHEKDGFDVMRSHQSAYEGSEEMPTRNSKYNAWSEEVKQLYSTGRNHNVIDKLPRLPARNVYASHFDGVMKVNTCFCLPCGTERTLRGSSRVKTVTNGM